MLLAGIDVSEALVLALAARLRRDDHAHTADTLEGAVAAHKPTVALTIPERMAILYVLLDPAPGSRSCAACCWQSTSAANAKGWLSHP